MLILSLSSWYLYHQITAAGIYLSYTSNFRNSTGLIPHNLRGKESNLISLNDDNDSINMELLSSSLFVV
jgi:hypothetical protein